MESNDELKEIDIKHLTCYYFDDIIKKYLTRFLLMEKTISTLFVTCIMIIELSHYI